MNDIEKLEKYIRYLCLVSTTAANSGHPTSSLSATDLMTVLMFGGFFKFDLDKPTLPNNDRLIFSKGHASPLFYSLYAAAGKVTEEEMMTLRKIDSRLEGHPTMQFPYTEAATGSLGQGLSVGLGMALNSKYVDTVPYNTFVLLGDSEMAEGSVWEALQLAVHYKLNNLIGILDVNRLGQRGETMYGHDTEAYEKRIVAFGWNVIVIDGHNNDQIKQAYEYALKPSDTPTMIIAKTIKGKGVTLLEDKDGWHGKALSPDQLKQALVEMGEVEKNVQGTIEKPNEVKSQKLKVKNTIQNAKLNEINYPKGTDVPTRLAYGNALARIFPQFPNIVVLDAETSNSTYAEIFQKAYPDRFFEMYIAEQNMVGTAIGLSRRDKIPFVSTFAAFFSRAFDQIRMSQYSDGNIKFVGSHAGVSIGEDGASQMGVEDIAMFRTLLGSVVLYPSDPIATEKLVEAAAQHTGNVYIRTTRAKTPVLYDSSEEFVIGGSKVVKQSEQDVVTVIGAGITLHEGLKAYEQLQKQNITIRVIDLYSIKPLDTKSLEKAAQQTKALIVVEDHHSEGGIGEAVRSALVGIKTPIYSLAVTKMPHSGTEMELLELEGISAKAIVGKVKEINK